LTDVGEDPVLCEICNAAHHRECWIENGGCAVAFCAGGPGPGNRQTTARPVLVVELDDEPPVDSPPTVARSDRRGAALILLGLLMLAGIAAAFAIHAIGH
jgi:hypothetical protein